MLAQQQSEAIQVLADVYLQQDQADKAALLLAALCELDPAQAHLLKALAYAQLEARQFEQALQTVDDFLRLGALSEADRPVLLLRSKALWELGRAGEARAGLQRYLQLVNETPA
jgi:predicted Zn-dependent protease